MASTSFYELYPFESHYLDIDGRKYHYLNEGTGDNTIVMLHGNPTWSFYFRNLVIALRKDFRVIVPDHMGCGFSDKPQDYKYRLENHVANLTRLLKHLEVSQATFFLHDWGGPIGLGYAVRYPEHIKRFVIFNTSCTLTSNFPWRILMCRIPLIGSILIRQFNFFAAAAARMACRNRPKMTTAVRAGYLKPYDSYQNRIANLRFVQDIPLTRRHPTWETAEDIQNQLEVLADKPIIICWGDQDFCFTEDFLEEWRLHFPNAIVHRFHDAGHYVVEDATDEILEVIKQFLECQS